jgi:excisionase family DNA binding protein
MTTLLTIPELADRLRCGRTKARQLARVIGQIKVGGSVLVSEAAVDAWLAGCEAGRAPRQQPKRRVVAITKSEFYRL